MYKNELGLVGILWKMSREAEPPRKFKNKTPTCKNAMFGGSFKEHAFKFIILCFAGLTIKDLVMLVMSYIEDPTLSDIKMVFNDSMQMPNFTFCMSKEQAFSHFTINATESTDEWDSIVDESLAKMDTHDKFMKELWDWHLVMEAYDLVSTFTSMERETTPHGSARVIHLFKTSPRLAGKRLTAEKWLKAIEDRNVTFDELTQKVGQECLRRSIQRFVRNTYDEDDVIKTNLKITWVSQMQLCFQPTWDKDNLKPISDQGLFFSLMMSHNTDKDEAYECMSVDLHGRPSSLNRFMEGKGRAKDGYNAELCLGQRHTVTVDLRVFYKMLPNEEDGTKCREIEDEMDDEFNCRSKCRMNMIRDICNCTGPTLSYLADDDDLKKYPICDYTKCTVDVQQGNFSDSECAEKCYRDCNQIRFSIDHEALGKMARPDLTMIQLNWGSFEYEYMEQEKKWSITEFIAALGGAIGMWLGLSMISLIQGGTYMYETICLRNKDNERKKTVVDPEPNEKKNSKKTSIGSNPFANPFEVNNSPMPEDKNNGPPPQYRGPASNIEVA